MDWPVGSNKIKAGLAWIGLDTTNQLGIIYLNKDWIHSLTSHDWSRVGAGSGSCTTQKKDNRPSTRPKTSNHSSQIGFDCSQYVQWNAWQRFLDEYAEHLKPLCIFFMPICKMNTTHMAAMPCLVFTILQWYDRQVDNNTDANCSKKKHRC
jgi:hypothetical protein